MSSKSAIVIRYDKCALIKCPKVPIPVNEKLSIKFILRGKYFKNVLNQLCSNFPFSVDLCPEIVSWMIQIKYLKGI